VNLNNPTGDGANAHGDMPRALVFTWNRMDPGEHASQWLCDL